jgi:hypothetical protein
MQKIRLFVELPLRRELIWPWFRIVARLGGTDGEENVSIASPNAAPKKVRYEENVKATKDGQLFLFVNNAVLAIPGYYGIFYGKNRVRPTSPSRRKTCFVCP